MMRAAAAETVRRSRIRFSLDRRLRCQGRARPAIAILMPISGRLDAPVSYTGMPPERVNEFTAAADSVRRSSAALAEGGRLRHASGSGDLRRPNAIPDKPEIGGPSRQNRNIAATRGAAVLRRLIGRRLPGSVNSNRGIFRRS